MSEDKPVEGSQCAICGAKGQMFRMPLRDRVYMLCAGCRECYK